MSGKSILGKSLFLFFVAVSAGILIFVTSFRKEAERKEPALPVQIVKAKRGDLVKSITVSGFIESDQMVTLLPRISGTLNDIYLEMGDAVEKDQVVALIDSEPYMLAYNQARAAYLAAESTFNRISSLYASKSVSQQNYDETKANFDALQASFELAELNLSYTKLKSPVSGVVLEKHVSKGSMVAPGVPVLTIGDLSDLRVKCGIPEIHYAYFSNGKSAVEVHIRVPAMNNHIYRGHISNVAPYISSGSRNFSVLCQIEDEEETLRPGMFAYVDFVMEKRENVYSLPYEILAGDKLWYLDEEEKPRFIIFKPDFGNEDAFLLPEEYADRQFISRGQHFLKEGQAVRVTGE